MHRIINEFTTSTLWPPTLRQPLGKEATNHLGQYVTSLVLSAGSFYLFALRFCYAFMFTFGLKWLLLCVCLCVSDALTKQR